MSLEPQPPAQSNSPPLLDYAARAPEGRALVRRDGPIVTLELPPRGWAHEARLTFPFFLIVPIVVLLVSGAMGTQESWQLVQQGVVWIVAGCGSWLVIAWIVGSADTVLQLTPEELIMEEKVMGMRSCHRWPRSAVLGVSCAGMGLRIKTGPGYGNGWTIRPDQETAAWIVSFLRHELNLPKT